MTTLATVLPVWGILILVNSSGKIVQRLHKNNQEATGQVTGFIAETFSAIQAIKVATAENSIIKQHRHLNKIRQEAAIKSRLFEAFLNSVVTNMTNIGTGLVLLIASPSFQSGMFTVGDLALFVFYLQWLTQSVGFFGQFFVRYKQSAISIQRMTRLLQGEPPATLVQKGPIYIWNFPPDVSYEKKQNTICYNK